MLAWLTKRLICWLQPHVSRPAALSIKRLQVVLQTTDQLGCCLRQHLEWLHLEMTSEHSRKASSLHTYETRKSSLRCTTEEHSADSPVLASRNRESAAGLTLTTSASTIAKRSARKGTWFRGAACRMILWMCSLRSLRYKFGPSATELAHRAGYKSTPTPYKDVHCDVHHQLHGEHGMLA